MTPALFLAASTIALNVVTLAGWARTHRKRIRADQEVAWLDAERHRLGMMWVQAATDKATLEDALAAAEASRDRYAEWADRCQAKANLAHRCWIELADQFGDADYQIARLEGENDRLAAIIAHHIAHPGQLLRAHQMRGQAKAAEPKIVIPIPERTAQLEAEVRRAA